MVGFVLQFVGLRSMHSAVSLLQLGVTLGMGVVRALLRTQRLKIEQNLLRDRPDEVSGHELDWLALQIGEEPNRPRSFWCITTGTAIDPPQQAGSEKTDQGAQTGTERSSIRAQSVYNYRTRLAGLTQQLANTKSKTSNAWDDGLVVGRSQAQQLSRAIAESLGILSANFKGRLKNEETIYWKLRIGMYGESSQPFPTPHDIVISIRKQNSVWAIDPNCLEAILGLCSWSITSDLCTEGETFRLKTSIAAGIPMYKIVSAGAEDKVKRTWEGLQLWMNSIPLSSSTITGTLGSLDSFDASPTTIWKLHPPDKEPFKKASHIPHDTSLLDMYGRLVGWQITGSHEKDVISAIRITSKSFPTICSQEIYQSFLCAISHHFDLDMEQVKVIKEANRFHLEHQLVTKLVDCFEMNRLGSRKDAYLTVIPALEYGSRLPRVKEAIPAAHQTAEGFRKDRRFQEAEAVLNWAWETASTMDESSETTMVELGELYRYALFSEEAAMQEFGRKGIYWMSKQVQSPGLEEINRRYSQLLEAQSKGPRTGKDVLGAISNQDRAETLLSLSLLKDKDLSCSVNGRTALSLAAEKGWHEVVKATLEIGSVVDSLDDQRRAPLSYAAEYGHVEVVQILMEARALPILEDSLHGTPLVYATTNGHILVMETLLKDPRVSVYYKDQSGESLLHWAASKGEDDIIRCLCKHGAQVNDTNNKGYTPLIVALLNNRRHKVSREQTATVLLEENAALNIIVQGEEAWCWALRDGELTCAEFLRKNDKVTANIGFVLEFQRPYHLIIKEEVGKVEPGVRIRVFDKDGSEIEPTIEVLCETAADECKVEVRCLEEGRQLKIADEYSYKFLNGIMD